MGVYSLSSNNSLGKYRLIAGLGHGGMADVYLVVANGLGDFNKLLVIKLLRNTDDPEYVKMFLEEARLAARLSHPNVVHTYEVGQEGDNYFLVMEFLHGPTLYSLWKIANKKKYEISPYLSLYILSNVLNGLQYAHDLKDYTGEPLNVIHRDLTPQNVIITFDGECKILDFGIAKANNSSCKTMAGVFKGKIAYASPEQAQLKKIDHRSDLFSAAVMLWEAIVGRTMWEDAPEPNIWLQLSRGEIPSLREAKPDAPLELIRICERGLAINPAQRFSSAKEFQHEIDSFLRKNGQHVDRQELADVVTTLFASDRAKVQSIIENQLAGNSSSDEAMPRLPRFGSTISGVSVLPGDMQSVPADSGVTKKIISRHTNVENKSKKTSKRLYYYSIAVVALLALAIFYWQYPMRVQTDPTPSPVRPAASQSSTSSAVTPIAKNVVTSSEKVVVAPETGQNMQKVEESTTIKLQILASPPSARLTLDSKLLSSNPFQGTYAKDEKMHEIRVAARGYRTETRKIRFNQDQIIKITLEKGRPPAKTKPSSVDLENPFN